MTFFQEWCLLRLARSDSPVALVGTAMCPRNTFKALRKMGFIEETNGRLLLTPSGREKAAELSKKPVHGGR